MKRLAFLVVTSMLVAAAVVGSAPGQEAPQVKAKPQPAYLGDTVRIRTQYWTDRTRPECTPRVKLQVDVGGRPKRIATANVQLGGVVVHDWVARGIKPGLYLLRVTQRCDFGEVGSSGDFRLRGPKLRVRPDYPRTGETVMIAGSGWASPKNCARRVALSLRRPGVVEKIGRPKVRKRKFSVKWNAEAPDAARAWKLQGVQRCKAGRKGFAIKRQTRIRIEPPQPEGV